MHPILREVRAALRRHADAERAPLMQRYMKSAMPFWGVAAPVQRKLLREIYARHPLACDEMFEVAREMFFEAKKREELYAAILLTDLRRHRECQRIAALPLYEEMIVKGAWWDVVDWIAGHQLGAILDADRRAMTARMKRWARDPHPWKRRAAILCQLGSKDRTDRELLYACIEPNVGDKDFFMRKAIGWALRQYARTEPREVKRYVEANRARLSPLSVREALKHVG